MDETDRIRQSEGLTALNITLQQIRDGQERIAARVDALRRELAQARDAREENSGFGLLSLGIFSGILIGTMIGRTIAGQPDDRAAVKDPP